MRRLLLLCLPLLLLMAACGGETAVQEAPPAVESVVDTAESTAPVAVEEEVVKEASDIMAGKSSVVTGANVDEASIIRPEDQFMGASEPTVTIIEYGDFQ